MCHSSINNWRKSRWTHGVVIEIVVAVVIVVVAAAVVVVKVVVPALVEVVGGNSGGSSNFVLGTFPVLSRDSQPVVKHKSFKCRSNLSDLRHLVLKIHVIMDPFQNITMDSKHMAPSLEHRDSYNFLNRCFGCL